MKRYVIRPDLRGLNKVEKEIIESTVIPVVVERAKELAMAMVSQQAQTVDTFKAIADGISVRQEGMRVVMDLVEEAEIFERGFASFDMKPSLLSHPSTQVGWDGEYRRVPLTGVVASPVHATTKKGYKSRKVHASITDDVNTRVIPEARRMLRSAGKARYKKHIRSKYGMGKNGQAPIRTVSRNSDPNSWIHPGLPGFRYGMLATKQARRELNAILDKIREMGIGE